MSCTGSRHRWKYPKSFLASGVSIFKQPTACLQSSIVNTLVPTRIILPEHEVLLLICKLRFTCSLSCAKAWYVWMHFSGSWITHSLLTASGKHHQEMCSVSCDIYTSIFKENDNSNNQTLNLNTNYDVQQWQRNYFPCLIENGLDVGLLSSL